MQPQLNLVRYTGFYPAQRMWLVESPPTLPTRQVDPAHLDRLRDVVYSIDRTVYSLRACRDGLIMIRIDKLEEQEAAPPDMEKGLARIGAYLDHLNAFSLLLDCVALKSNLPLAGQLSEVTNRDVIRVTFENGKIAGENVPLGSVASLYQAERYGAAAGFWGVTFRPTLSTQVLDDAVATFDSALQTDSLIARISAFAKSLAEFKVGNLEVAIVLAWFIIEAALSVLWERHLDTLNLPLADGSKRINSKRREFLTGRDMPMSMMSNHLELWGCLSSDEFRAVDSVRGFRNRIVHELPYAPKLDDVKLALETAQRMIARCWGFTFTPNLGLSYTW